MLGLSCKIHIAIAIIDQWGKEASLNAVTASNEVLDIELYGERQTSKVGGVDHSH